MAEYKEPNGKFYDPYYLEDGRKKEITTLAEALILVDSDPYCSGTACDDCPRRMYSACGDGCKSVKAKAKAFVEEKAAKGTKIPTLNANELSRKDEAVERANVFYEFVKLIVEHDTPADPKDEKPSCGICETCEHFWQQSGVPFCHAWHNFTNPEGYCYMYSAILEEGTETA